MTPNELEQGRALLAKCSKGTWECGNDEYMWNVWVVEREQFHPLSEREKDALMWLRNHAAELLDAAAIGLGRTCYDASAEALEAERAHADRLADMLADLAEHGRDCIHSRLDAGRPTASGGYESCFAGKWYETRPVDRTPPCTCGLSAILAAHAARRQKETNDAASVE